MKMIAAVIAGLACLAAMRAGAEPLGAAFSQGSSDVAATRQAMKDSAAARAKAQAQAAAGNGAGISWTKIPGTTAGKKFVMGSDDGYSSTEFSWAQPAHAITVDSFEMAKTPVTNKQYAACVAAGACTPIDGDCLSDSYEGDDKPVVCVTWAQAKAFAKWVGGRLPSEAEYEYAERGAGQSIKYPWGDAAPTCDKAVYYGCGTDGPQPVCSKPAGNTKQGLCDMAGNVWEWTQDVWHDNYQGAPADGKAWEGTGSYRVIRGGSWYNYAGSLRAADRGNFDPGYRYDYLGFRPVRSSR
jgi:formylglycine-generating enzyme required for sulfatase activity